MIPNDWRDVALFVKAKPHIKDAGIVLDVGAGLRPQTLVTCANHICIEPHHEYTELLWGEGYTVICAAAPAAFDLVHERIDTVTMLDVIEHMEKADGRECIARACALAQQQVIVFTPLGFMEPVIYGLTKNIDTYQPARIATHEYKDMLRDVATSTTWRDRLSFVLRGPGWAYARHAQQHTGGVS